MYYEGQGLDKSARQAYYWLKVAALQGDDEARTALPVVAKGMNADEIRDADSQAGDWMKKYKKVVGQ
jgi:TPR repeat protein